MFDRRLESQEFELEHHIDRLIREYELLPLCHQKAVDHCNPDVSTQLKDCNTLLDCHTKHFLVTRKCQLNEVELGYYCLRKCRQGDSEAQLLCPKEVGYQREVSKTNPGGAHQQWSNNLFPEKCKSNYKELGLNFCIYKCPIGTYDTGNHCY